MGFDLLASPCRENAKRIQRASKGHGRDVALGQVQLSMWMFELMARSAVTPCVRARGREKPVAVTLMWKQDRPIARKLPLSFPFVVKPFLQSKPLENIHLFPHL